ncbi:uncharacterized protein HD556DRAFT_1313621 [Suillus plorans]|uniref:Uncharacterized protein n=1 Tax=Suillus plorans TaxID=116603 RepID=A0A9P7ADU3_9AGAM|nr:uncharacterized protein HD556DRAFT_1313621 [Suillus plorans]KAG1786274.1 hypothetical protein HD556DRAFT_1313621 [Suillus plorans]
MKPESHTICLGVASASSQSISRSSDLNRLISGGGVLMGAGGGHVPIYGDYLIPTCRLHSYANKLGECSNCHEIVGVKCSLRSNELADMCMALSPLPKHDIGEVKDRLAITTSKEMTNDFFLATMSITYLQKLETHVQLLGLCLIQSEDILYNCPTRMLDYGISCCLSVDMGWDIIQGLYNVVKEDATGDVHEDADGVPGVSAPSLSGPQPGGNMRLVLKRTGSKLLAASWIFELNQEMQQGGGNGLGVCFREEFSVPLEPSSMPAWSYLSSLITRERIIAHNLKDWIQHCGIIWECFCALVTEQLCFKIDSSVNLSEARETALLESTYTNHLMQALHVPSVRQQIHCPSANVNVGSSSVLIDELASLSMTEQGILHPLAEGRGVTWYDGIGLLESCGSCQRVFAASALWTHILTCAAS